MPNFDATMLGTGQSGTALARRLVAAGFKVAIIERKLFGGTCINTGCTPTKTLVASAYAAHIARRAAEYGVSIQGNIGVDMKRVKARKDAIVEQWRAGLRASLSETKNCTFYEGHARLVSEREVSIGEKRFTTERIFINTGGRSSAPPIPGLEAVPYLTNSSMLDVDFVPQHLLILGGSYIGLEFGQIYRRFGAKVTIIEMAPRLIAREDEEISATIKDILKAEGIDIHLNARCLSVAKKPEGVTLRLNSEAGPLEIEGSHLLLAAGRRPNTDDLGLEAAGVLQDARGYITVDDELRTNVPGIWALGDCNGRGAFTHTSWNDYEIVAANLLDGGHRRVSDRITAYALYTDPPLGRAGMTEAEVRRSGRRALVGKIAMEDVSRAWEKSETEGFMKMLIDADTKEILGASFLGVGGDEVVHCVLDVMY